MSRREEAVGGNYLKNPSELYLEYNSDEKCFVYYNKETKENVKVGFPFKFVFLDERQTVGGWSKAEECSLYANEVKYLGKEELTVKYSKGKALAVKGLYKDIKEKLTAIGGKYYRSIYLVFEGKIVNLKLKGSATAAWGDFASKNKNKFLTNYIIIEDVVAKKSGGIKYTVPIFEIGEEIENGEVIDTIAEPLYEYLDQKKSNYEPDENDDIHASVEEQIAEPVAVGEEDDLPF
jgi:hypothetical protein